MVYVKVKIKPNSEKQEIIRSDDEDYIVKVKSPAQNNKANIEMIKLLEKYFKRTVRIKSGFRGRKKIVEVME